LQPVKHSRYFGRLQIIKCSVFTLGSLDSSERFDDGPPSLPGLDQPRDGGGLLAKPKFHFRLQLDLIQVFGQAAVIIIVRLSHPSSIESFGNDRIGDSEAKQFRVL